MAAPVLTDGVVTLTAHQIEDAPDILRGRQLPEVERAWRGTRVPDLAAAERLVQYALERWAEEENYFWAFAIRRREHGPFLGSLIVHHSMRGAGSVMDIWLLPEHRGAGIARRAAVLGLGYVFDDRGMPWVDLEVLPGYDPAQRLALALGFARREGERGFRDATRLTIITPFRMTRESWEARAVDDARD